MTGENFKILNRKQNTLTEELNDAKIAFTQYAKADGEKWSWEELRRLENQVERLEYAVWCDEYEDNRRRTWG